MYVEKINDKGTPLEKNQFLALNEVSISRGQAEWMVQFEVYINDILLTIV